MNTNSNHLPKTQDGVAKQSSCNVEPQQSSASSHGAAPQVNPASNSSDTPQQGEVSKLFRQASLENTASPDHLDQYIKVNSPAAWIALGALAFALLAGLAWAFSIPYEKTTDAVIEVVGGQIVGEVELPDGGYPIKIITGESTLASSVFGSQA